MLAAKRPILPQCSTRLRYKSKTSLKSPFHYKSTSPKMENVNKQIGREAAEFDTIFYMTPVQVQDGV